MNTADRNKTLVPPILHIMRHGQGYHSITENGHDLRDPELTPEGEQQCRDRRDGFDRHDNVRCEQIFEEKQAI